MKRILSGFQINFSLLFLLCSLQLSAQKQSLAIQPVQSQKIEMKIFGNIQQSDVAKMENVLTGYPGKIMSHSYSSNKSALFIFVSEKTDPIDILQVLKMNGIKAGYRDYDNGYVTLEPDGHSTRKIFFKE